MERNMKVILLMIRERVKENSYGKMEESIMGTGKTANNTAVENS